MTSQFDIGLLCGMLVSFLVSYIGRRPAKLKSNGYIGPERKEVTEEWEAAKRKP